MTAITQLMNLNIVDRLLTDRGRLTVFENFEQGMLALFVFFIGLSGSLLIYAAYFYLAVRYPSLAAIGMAGALSLGFALIIGLAVFLIHSYRLSQLRKLQLGFKEKVQSALKLLDEEFGDSVRDNPKLAVILAAAAGYLLEERI